MENPKQATIKSNEQRPLPDSKYEARRLAGHFKNLTEKEIEGILDIVLSNIGKSRKFGLALDPAIQEREELFYLTAIEKYGGTVEIPKNHTFEEMSEIIGAAASGEFAEESRADFEELTKKGNFGDSKNRFNNHLEAATGDLLNMIFSGRIPR